MGNQASFIAELEEQNKKKDEIIKTLSERITTLQKRNSDLESKLNVLEKNILFDATPNKNVHNFVDDIL